MLSSSNKSFKLPGILTSIYQITKRFDNGFSSISHQAEAHSHTHNFESVISISSGTVNSISFDFSYLIYEFIDISKYKFSHYYVSYKISIHFFNSGNASFLYFINSVSPFGNLTITLSFLHFFL